MQTAPVWVPETALRLLLTVRDRVLLMPDRFHTRKRYGEWESFFVCSKRTSRNGLRRRVRRQAVDGGIWRRRPRYDRRHLRKQERTELELFRPYDWSMRQLPTNCYRKLLLLMVISQQRTSRLKRLVQNR